MHAIKLCFLVAAICLASGLPVQKLHPDTGLNIIEMVERQGYPIERHQNVVTADGYILEMHRIPHKKDQTDPDPNRPVVFLMHGILSSSTDWVNMGPGWSIAYLLVEEGYDVWMGNARGTTWSRNHTTLNPDKDHDFWKFSWNEIGVYDLPVMIDYVLTATGQESLFYIGHSQGTTSFYVMTAERPEYNAKIRLMSSLAPIGFMSHTGNLFFQLISKFEGAIDWISRFLGAYEFLPHSELLALIGEVECKDGSSFQGICENILFLICGFDSEQLNSTMIPVINSNLPAGAATRQVVHYAQEINSGKFRKYDFGLFQNLAEYGQTSPPNYNLTQITAPVALFYGANDLIAGIKDVDKLYEQLGHPVYKFLVPFEKFNHLDFLFAINVKELVYDHVLALMRKY